MKKIFIALVFALATIGSGFAQADYSGIEGFDDFFSGGPDKIGLRVGLYGDFQPALGGLAEFVFGGVGGGINAEYDIVSFTDLPISVGASVRLGGNVGLLKSDLISSLFNMQAFAGAYVRVPILETGVFVQPEISYGVTANFPKVNPAYPGNTLKSCYLDQSVQAAVSVRYSPNIMENMLEFEAAPVYTLCTEQGTLVHYIGARVGVMISL